MHAGNVCGRKQCLWRLAVCGLDGARSCSYVRCTALAALSLSAQQLGYITSPQGRGHTSLKTCGVIPVANWHVCQCQPGKPHVVSQQVDRRPYAHVEPHITSTVHAHTHYTYAPGTMCFPSHDMLSFKYMP